MMAKIQRLKSKKGFTMVELIVVIAIIAVLSAIIIPLAINYLGDARKTSANTSASTIQDLWTNKVTELVTSNKIPQNVIFTYDFANKTAAVISGGAGTLTDTDALAKTHVETEMQKAFEDVTTGIAVVQIYSAGGTSSCGFALFCPTETSAAKFTFATDVVSYDGTAIMNVKTAAGPAAAQNNAVGAAIIGTSPQLPAGAVAATTT